MKNVLPPFIEIYRALIATPSISATEESLDQSNASLITLLAGWFSDLGFNVEVQPVPGTRNKFNMLASTGHGAGGLLLTGHTDTVPFDDGRWTRDPFTLTEHDNKLYGLGTADMKGFFAFILDALRDVDVTKLKKPLYILATADEETSMAGARYFSKPRHYVRTARSLANRRRCNRYARTKGISLMSFASWGSPVIPATRRVGLTPLN